MPTINAGKYGYLVQSSTVSFTALRNGTTALQVNNQPSRVMQLVLDFAMYLEVKVASGNCIGLIGLSTPHLILLVTQ